MTSTCLHCNRPLGTNEVLETLPIGRRIAFDAAQGRLWVVCKHCGKWNLVPFDTRLESIDAAERLYRDTVTRFSTDNIGLARVREGLELVRIGEALRPEFASWRYGESYRRRRRNSYLVGGATVGAIGAGFVALGGLGVLSAGFAYSISQFLKAGWEAAINRRARFRVADPERDAAVRVERAMSRKAVISWETGMPMLELPAPTADKKGIRLLRWGEAEVQSVGRRVTGSLNILHGSRKELDAATRLLADERGDLALWLRQRADAQRAEGKQEINKRQRKAEGTGWKRIFPWERYDHPFLIPGRLPVEERLAVELWMNEDLERTWLEGELKLLEREWREAERLARITDSLVTEGIELPDG